MIELANDIPEVVFALTERLRVKPEGASLVQNEPSEEARREAKFERMEESLEPITDDQAEGGSE